MQVQLNLNGRGNGNGKVCDTALIRDVLMAVRNVPAAVCEALDIDINEVRLGEFDLSSDGNGAVFALTGITLEVRAGSHEFVLTDPAGNATDECRVDYVNPTKRDLREAKGFILEARARNVVDGVSILRDAVAQATRA